MALPKRALIDANFPRPVFEHVNAAIVEMSLLWHVLERSLRAVAEQSLSDVLSEAVAGPCLTYTTRAKDPEGSISLVLRFRRVDQDYRDFFLEEMRWVREQVVGDCAGLVSRAKKIHERIVERGAADVPRGEYRTLPATVLRSRQGLPLHPRYLGYSDCRMPEPSQISCLMDLIDDFRSWPLRLDLLPGSFTRTFLISTLALDLLLHIHPFGDGNGRTARLIAYSIMLEEGYPEHLARVPINIINTFRDPYYQALNESHRAGNPQPFIYFMVKKVLRALFMVRAARLLAKTPFLSSKPARFWELIIYPLKPDGT